MYVPENRARANQRKMNDVIDNPDHQLLILRVGKRSYQKSWEE
jgi:hypothetical protein